MKLKSYLIAVLLSLSFATLGGEVKAHDRSCQSELSKNISVRFNLNEAEVKQWMDTHFRDYKYNCTVTHSITTDNTSYNNHLTFIDNKLSLAVSKGKITQTQKDQIMAKIRQKMEESKNTNYQNMTVKQRQAEINQWKREMEIWAKENGISLGKIRSLTGKGNKYLMGM